MGRRANSPTRLIINPKKMTDNIIKRIQSRSQRRIENPTALKNYLKQTSGGKKMTFFNWECPPRFIDKDKKGKQFVNYLVDFEKIFSGTKFDKYTELPRVVESFDEERRFLVWLNKLGINYRFVKLIADTNAEFITPESLDILGAFPVRRIFGKFKKFVQKRAKKYPAETKVYLFTELIKGSKLYDDAYDLALKFIEPKILKQQCERTRKHMGLTDPDQIKQIAARTIATYAAEGVMLEQLSESPRFSNAVWLNNHEIDSRTIIITNLLRKRWGLGNLPMIFPK